MTQHDNKPTRIIQILVQRAGLDSSGSVGDIGDRIRDIDPKLLAAGGILIGLFFLFAMGGSKDRTAQPDSAYATQGELRDSRVRRRSDSGPRGTTYAHQDQGGGGGGGSGGAGGGSFSRRSGTTPTDPCETTSLQDAVQATSGFRMITMWQARDENHCDMQTGTRR